MDFLARLTFGYGSRILAQFQCERRDAVGGLLRASDPIPNGSQIFIVERQSANVLIKLDRIPQALLGVLHATGGARVAGKVERITATLG
jgi:hypothetical protein